MPKCEPACASQRDTVPAVTIDYMAFHRMFTACKRTRALVAENPVQPDYSGDHEAAESWPLITAAYNGIEQALKMLLLAPKHTKFTMKQLKNQPYRHDLEALYGALEPDDSDYIEKHFREHWSLNEYQDLKLGFDTAKEFISNLNKSQPQEGSLAWRYALLDMSVPIPKTNPWTMCEVWYAICCRIKAGVYDRQDGTFRLSGRLRFRFERVILHWGEVYGGFTDDLNCWIGCTGDELGAWVDLLVKASKGAIDEVEAPERLRPHLSRMADRAIEALSRERADPDVQKFLLQVQRTDRDLTWDPQQAEFGWANNKVS